MAAPAQPEGQLDSLLQSAIDTATASAGGGGERPTDEAEDAMMLVLDKLRARARLFGVDPKLMTMHRLTQTSGLAAMYGEAVALVVFQGEGRNEATYRNPAVAVQTQHQIDALVTQTVEAVRAVGRESHVRRGQLILGVLVGQ